jgi:phospholipid-transporting ATPase
MIEIISPTHQIPVMFIPLIMIVVINTTRDYIEDKKRQEADKKENLKIAMKLQGDGVVSEIRQQDLRVGDMLRIEADMEVPADCVVVGSSEMDTSCFVETKNLDGEISLKMKSTSRFFRKSEYVYTDFFEYDCIFQAENPNINLYQFNGTLKIRGELFPFTNENFLPRGATIRHTSWVVGLVVYTG